MALINDGFDPSGMGMFSKTGRFTTEKFYILRMKDEILSSEKKTLDVPLFTTSQKIKEVLADINYKKDMMMIKRFDTAGPNSNKPDFNSDYKDPEEIKKKLPMSKTTSRDQMEKMRRVKYPAPPLGIYNPKFVKKSIPVLFNYGREMNKNGSKIRENTSSILDERYEYEMANNPDKLHKKVPGFIDLDRQLEREEFVGKKNDLDPEGKRFSYYQTIPDNSSRAKNVMTINMKSGKWRPEVFPPGPDHPDYKPKYEYGKRRIGSAVTRFSTLSGRSQPVATRNAAGTNPDKHQSYTNNEDRYNYDAYRRTNRSQQWKRINVPNLELAMPREKYPECGLPSFMQGQGIRPVTAEPIASKNFRALAAKSRMNKSVTNKFKKNKEGSVVESHN